MRRARLWVCALLSSACCGAIAHEGRAKEPADQDAAASAGVAATAVTRPRLLAEGQLYVPKSVQHLLGLRTLVLATESQPVLQLVAGEVIADPDAGGSVKAAQAGQLEAPTQGWPLPGDRIRAGQTLAWLRPLLTQAEQAQRRAALAQLQQDLQIAEINVERLKTQTDASGNIENGGNVYYEQARLAWEGLKEKVRLELAALDSRAAIRAPIAGLLRSVAAQAGETVAPGQALFELADPAHLRIALSSFDATLASRVQGAQLRNSDGRITQLTLRGQEPLADQAGWRLLFDAKPPPQAALTPGQIVAVELRVLQAVSPQLSTACVAGVDGSAGVWVHAAPERFERRGAPGCAHAGRGEAGETPAAPPLAAGERVVVQGGALLSEYH